MSPRNLQPSGRRVPAIGVLVALAFLLTACDDPAAHRPEPTTWLQFANDNIWILLIALFLIAGVWGSRR